MNQTDAYEFRVKVDGEFVGWLTHKFSYKNQYYNYIARLDVVPEFRNRGYGFRILTTYLEKYNLMRPIYLHVRVDNKKAIHLYKKVGFRFVKHDDIYDEFMLMEKTE